MKLRQLQRPLSPLFAFNYTNYSEFHISRKNETCMKLIKKFIACLSTAIGKEYYCYVFFLHQSIIDHFHISFLLFYIHVHGCCLCLPNCLPHLLSVIY